MKKMAVLLAGAMLMVGVYSGIASATTINYLSTNTANDKTSIYTGLANFQIETFNNAGLGHVNTSGLIWDWTSGAQDNASVVKGALDGRYAPPFGLTQADQTNYISVPNPDPSGSVTVNLGGGLYNYFGLWWGSVDAGNRNVLSFLKSGVEVASYTGTLAISPSVANGNQTAQDTNVYINFLDLPDFDSFKMASTQYAFEADNIAIGNVVPEPGTIILLGAGLLGLGFYGRRKVQK